KEGAVVTNINGDFLFDRGLANPSTLTISAYWNANKYSIYLYPNAKNVKLEKGGELIAVSDSKKAGKCASVTATFDSTTFIYNGSETGNLNNINYVRPGYVFKEWNTKKNGKGKAYSTDEALNLTTKANGSVVLYAIWTKVAPARVTGITADNRNTLYFNEQNNAGGYELQYADRLTAVTSAPIIEVYSSGTRELGESEGKVYVRIRAFAYDSAGEKIYGAWSFITGIKLRNPEE
ncbi:MAG: InlB B-repeat-containing protein, partial [Lachnospiraceae bacterium]|nr:InlB B-repeat-containing protein [Lachnospiraceae bacterium]